jgi:hypothetical protein
MCLKIREVRLHRFSEQEEICRRLPNLDGLSRCLHNKGLVFLRTGEILSAISCFEEQRSHCERLKNEACMKQAIENLIKAYILNGDMNKIDSLFHKKPDK